MGWLEDTTQSADASKQGGAQRTRILRGVLPQSTEECFLRGARLLLGRSEEADLRLPGQQASRRHAEIYRQGPLFALRDLNSRNGTYVDGQRVQHCAVRDGMLLRIGDFLGMVEELGDADLEFGFGELAPGLFGGPKLAPIVRALNRVARSLLPVVLVGATGTGKERFARALHLASEVKGPFQAVNCAALPAGLAEAELFGYRRGAFTGAERAHEGHLRAASGGTLFLDEIAELPLTVQSKLLRAMDVREIMPLGETRPVRFDARVVVASQQPLQTLTAARTFREDLAARLSGAELELPPLRRRASDVPGLLHRFLFELCGGRPPRVSVQLYEKLCLYQWPGNVRELELLARRLIAECGLEPVLRCSDLPERFLTPAKAEPESGSSAPPEATRHEHDLSRLKLALSRTGGNVSLAAELAGFSRQRAYRLMRQSQEVQAKFDSVTAEKNGADIGGSHESTG